MATTPSPSSPTENGPIDQGVQGATVAAKAVTASEVSDLIDLPNGREISESSALAFANSRPVRWIVLAGQVGSGKTTLLTSLYDMFQWSRVGGFRFGGSRTLPGFEQRCHLSRAASERVVPDTSRTPYSPIPTFLHLRVSPADEVPSAIDFLFTDVSGEMFEHACNSTDECKELHFLRRAAAFVLILDGEKATRPERRWAMVEEAQGLLRSCLDSSMLAEDCKVIVLWSKGDCLETATESDEVREFRSEVERGFRAVFDGRLKHLAFDEIAARPTKAPQLGFGRGLAELLLRWAVDKSESAGMNLFPGSLKGSS